MYELTSFWFVRRTRATLRIAELGFLGVVVYTRTHTPRRCGQLSKAGLALLLATTFLPFLTNCEIVGMMFYFLILYIYFVYYQLVTPP
jgi:hypothetical protein